LVHISELEWNRVEKVEDVLQPGDAVRVKLIKIDDQGRLDFSRRALLEKPEGYVERPKKQRQDNDRGGRRPFKKRRF
jgi:polyribonucleotide nucleotidyltransferase